VVIVEREAVYVFSFRRSQQLVSDRRQVVLVQHFIGLDVQRPVVPATIKDSIRLVSEVPESAT
jgi:hypothetical protein